MKDIFIDIRKEGKAIQEYFENKDYVTIEDLLNAVDDLIYEKNSDEERYKDEISSLEEDIRENYRRKTDYEILGMSEDDFC